LSVGQALDTQETSVMRQVLARIIGTLRGMYPEVVRIEKVEVRGGSIEVTGYYAIKEPFQGKVLDEGEFRATLNNQLEVVMIEFPTTSTSPS